MSDRPIQIGPSKNLLVLKETPISGHLRYLTFHWPGNTVAIQDAERIDTFYLSAENESRLRDALNRRHEEREKANG